MTAVPASERPAGCAPVRTEVEHCFGRTAILAADSRPGTRLVHGIGFIASFRSARNPARSAEAVNSFSTSVSSFACTSIGRDRAYALCRVPLLHKLQRIAAAGCALNHKRSGERKSPPSDQHSDVIDLAIRVASCHPEASPVLIRPLRPRCACDATISNASPCFRMEPA